MGAGVRRLWWPTALALVLLACACAPSAQSSAQARADQGAGRLKFFLTKICLPVIADQAPFDTLVEIYHLKKRTTCDIQECRTSYCTPGHDQICFSAPSRGSCWTAVYHDPDFANLNAEVSDILRSDTRAWTEVRPASHGAGRKKAFCSADRAVTVRTEGFLPGDVLAPPTPPRGNGPGTPAIVVRNAEFDIHVSIVRQPDWCAPL